MLLMLIRYADEAVIAAYAALRCHAVARCWQRDESGDGRRRDRYVDACEELLIAMCFAVTPQYVATINIQQHGCHNPLRYARGYALLIRC